MAVQTTVTTEPALAAHPSPWPFGLDERTHSLFSCVDLELVFGSDHPLRTIHAIVNAALGEIDGDFAKLYPLGLSLTVDRDGASASGDVNSIRISFPRQGWSQNPSTTLAD